jgi:putative ABC transport system substrate-binding protein
MTSRRAFLATLAGGSIVSASMRVLAQNLGKDARIGLLAAISAPGVQPNLRVFLEALRGLGWIEGQNLTIEYSYDTPGGPTLDERASQLAKFDLRLVVADSTPTSLALKRAGFSRPVVFVAVSEPVEIGLADSLAKPGHNFTGFTTVNRELIPKRIELIKELVPRVPSDLSGEPGIREPSA